MSATRNRYRRHLRRRSFVLTRLGRLLAIGMTLLLCLPVVAVGVAVLAWSRVNLPNGWSMLPVSVSLMRAARASRPFRGRRRLRAPVYPSVMPAPPGIVAAVEDLAPAFGMRARRIQVVVQRYGRGRASDLPLAAAAGWLGGGVVIADDDLAAKSLASHPGDGVDEEVRAVVTHELGHLFAFHSVTAVAERFTLTAVVATALCVVAQHGVAQGGFEAGSLLLAGAALAAVALLSVLVIRWVSRLCEYAADDHAAAVMGSGAALAAALTHDFGGDCRGWRALLSTHPPITKRSARLRRVA